MTSPAKTLRAEIEDSANGIITDIRPFAQGHGTRLFLVDFRDGRRMVAKLATDRRSNANIDLEGWMLCYLRDNTSLPVPRVVSSAPGRLLMNYMPEGGAIDEHVALDAADHLAALHGIVGIKYGLDRNTVIGGLTQDNTTSGDWITFFRERRLLFMARAALEEARIDAPLMKRFEKLAIRLDELLDNPAPPSLIHGDVWAGNVLAGHGKVEAFIDPAIYYADPEIELAFISLFHTFDRVFFARYAEHRPIRDGFRQVRRDIYNLYPLLVHVRLFGNAYLPPIQRILDRFVA